MVGQLACFPGSRDERLVPRWCNENMADNTSRALYWFFYPVSSRKIIRLSLNLWHYTLHRFPILYILFPNDPFQICPRETPHLSPKNWRCGRYLPVNCRNFEHYSFYLFIYAFNQTFCNSFGPFSSWITISSERLIWIHIFWSNYLQKPYLHSYILSETDGISWRVASDLASIPHLQSL